MTTIDTKRLRLTICTQQQMQEAIAAQTDEELKSAYGEMLEGCLRHPEQWDWYAMWRISQKDGTPVGDLCFKGLLDGVAEIGYGLAEGYRGLGYATEAVAAALRWAFAHPEVSAIEAETEPDNAASQHVLAKCGFVSNGRLGREGPRFVRTRQQIE